MYDLETLSVDVYAAEPVAVVSLGAVVFEPETAETHGEFEAMVSPFKGRGGVVSPDTLAWWMAQEDAARQKIAKALTEGHSMAETLRAFNVWFAEHFGDSEPDVWADFCLDHPTMYRHYQAHGIDCPWDWHQAHDRRTLTRFYGLSRDDYNMGCTDHDAVGDCVTQIRMLRAAYRRKRLLVEDGHA